MSAGIPAVRHPGDKPTAPAVPNLHPIPDPSIYGSGAGAGTAGSSASRQEPSIGELLGNTYPNPNLNPSPEAVNPNARGGHNTSSNHSVRSNQSFNDTFEAVSPVDKSLLRHYTNTSILFSNPAVIAGTLYIFSILLRYFRFEDFFEFP